MAKKYWLTSDGVKIPHQSNPDRKDWDKRFMDAIVEHHAYGNRARLVPITIPVSQHSMGHFVPATTDKAPVGKGGRYRVKTYIRMLAAGETLPPIVVRRNGNSFTVIDGNARMRAALEHGKTTHLSGYELLDADKVPPPKPKKTKKFEPVEVPDVEPLIKADTSKPEFQNWFAGSKTVDEQGKPKVFYRGTTRPQLQGRISTQSFADNPNISNIYSADPQYLIHGQGATVHPHYIKMVNPLVLDNHKSSFGDILRALKYERPNGITHDESLKLLNFLANRVSGKVQLPDFNYHIEPRRREYDPEDEGFDEDEDDHEYFSVRHSPVKLFRDEWEWEPDDMEDVHSEPGGPQSDRLIADTFAWVDAPRFKEVAARLGYDGVVHRDVLSHEEALKKLGGSQTPKRPTDIGMEMRYDAGGNVPTHLTYRPFSDTQIRPLYHEPDAKLDVPKADIKLQTTPPKPAPQAPVIPTTKAEDLAKMAIKDLRPGPGTEDEYHITHDYTHLLSPILRRNYKLTVRHNRDQDFLQVRVVHRTEGKVGYVDGGIEHAGIGLAVNPNMTEIPNPKHRGLGLGKAMYEAMLTHAYHVMGIKNVAGDTHSTSAHNVHQALSEQHGMDYSADKVGRGEAKDFDGAYGPYEYKIR